MTPEAGRSLPFVRFEGAQFPRGLAYGQRSRTVGACRFGKRQHARACVPAYQMLLGSTPFATCLLIDIGRVSSVKVRQRSGVVRASLQGAMCEPRVLA